MHKQPKTGGAKNKWMSLARWLWFRYNLHKPDINSIGTFLFLRPTFLWTSIGEFGYELISPVSTPDTAVGKTDIQYDGGVGYGLLLTLPESSSVT